MALCGKVWIPNRDPSRYPVCPTCKEIRARLRNLKKSFEFISEQIAISDKLLEDDLTMDH